MAEGGDGDSPLTAVGVEQARLVAESLVDEFGGFAAIYSSPLRRALDTAAAVCARVGGVVQQVADLAEGLLGEWNGMQPSAGDWSLLQQDAGFVGHGGESPSVLADRGAAALRSIAAAHTDATVLVVSHGGTISHALARLLDASALPERRYQLGNGERVVLESAGSWRLRTTPDGP